MALNNQQRVRAGLDLLTPGLFPFVEREMKAQHGDGWTKKAQDSFRSGRGADKTPGTIHWDSHALLTVMADQWNIVFKKTLGQSERSLIGELREVRNHSAHEQKFSTDDTYRALDSIQRLLTAVSAEEADEIERMKRELMHQAFDRQVRNDQRRLAAAPTEGQPMAGLRPWREVVTPHGDVASGNYAQAEFAADLWQVYQGEGVDEYRDPTEFFRRTYLTEGLRDLLVGALRRLGDTGGDPVIELQTNFGGGKTHSLLALYHLCSGCSAAELPGVEALMLEAKIEAIPTNVNRAVLVGHKISPGKPSIKEDGTEVRTLWGELAWQLGGAEGYAMVAEDDHKATNPGDTLRLLFNKYAPCVVLIDEWIRYAAQLHETSDLPGGSFDTHFTFAQALSEAAKAADRTMLLVSIPASEIEFGGDRGKEALTRLKNAIGRVEAPWRPASAEESYEIVRRRLFEPISDPELLRARDTVARNFCDMYHSQKSEFPGHTHEADYERRIVAAYPIHPELFDRLHTDWSTLEKFQRTRGVLRLMAAVIHVLWERQDGSLLIMPASVPIDDPLVHAELTRYLEDNWSPIIETDVDGPQSLPLRLDRENPNLGRYSACRRVTRTLYLGSAPTQNTANRGLEDRHVRLGCVQPGESTATFGDALRRLTDKATHLYVDGQRYWYSTQPNVTRVADDRAVRFPEDIVTEEIKSRLREEQRRPGDFVKVHPCPGSTGDVPDESEARLVILSPEYPHAAKETNSPANVAAAELLDQRGTGPRLCKNAIVFLAADRNRLGDLEQAVRQYLAWKSIDDGKVELNLDAFQSKQAKTKREQSDDTVDQRVPETYQWLLVPTQPDPKGAAEWQATRLQGQDTLAVRAAKKLKNEGLLITQFGGATLRLELDKVPLWRGDHVAAKQLADDFSQYLYLPRLRNNQVLVDAIKDGLSLLTWREDGFAYADAYDADAKRYRGLKTGPGSTVTLDGESVLVKPETATRQIESDEAKQKEKAGQENGTDGTGTSGGSATRIGDGTGTGGTTIEDVTPKKARRFYGSVQLDATRLGRDAGKIADEVLSHLTGLVGAKAEITLEIQVDVPDGVPDHAVRTVTENARTLKFKSQGFEES